MYELTLTGEERKAIEWVGYRYFHGDDLLNILIGYLPSDPERMWRDFDVDITFVIPEHKAWDIEEGIANEDYQLACFSPRLKAKLIDFCDSIV